MRRLYQEAKELQGKLFDQLKAGEPIAMAPLEAMADERDESTPRTLEGLTIHLTVEPKKQRVQDMQDGTFELGLTRWGPDYADPETFTDPFKRGGNYNFPEYTTEVDENGKNKYDVYEAMVAEAKAILNANMALIKAQAPKVEAAAPLAQAGNESNGDEFPFPSGNNDGGDK